MPDANPALTIGGMVYEGWTGVSVTRDIERMAGRFQLSLTDKWPGIEQLRPVKPGMRCALTNDGDTLVTGWLDAVEVEIRGDDHAIVATGRDKTGDLVDCAAAGEWTDQTLQSIAREICAPFGIGLDIEASAALQTIRKFKVEEGETAFNAIERLCRIKGLLATSWPDGRLRITTAGFAKPVSATLRTGKGGNVLTAKATFDHSERFSVYTVKGQDGAFDFETADEAASPSGQASDGGVGRYRPTTIIAEEQVDKAACQARAEWEGSVRAGRSRRLVAQVQGWYHGAGLWQPLTTVDCEIPAVNLSGRMLISAVTYTLGDDGTTAELTLADPDAFTGLAQPETTEETWGW